MRQNLLIIIPYTLYQPLYNGNPLWSPAESNNCVVARVVTLSRKSCHITPILKGLHWLPVSQRIVSKLMLIFHKSFNNIAPSYISELLKVYTAITQFALKQHVTRKPGTNFKTDLG